MIADNPAETKAAGEALWAVTIDAEKKMEEKQDKVERAEAEAAKKGEAEDNEDLGDIDKA